MVLFVLGIIFDIISAREFNTDLLVKVYKLVKPCLELNNFCSQTMGKY